MPDVEISYKGSQIASMSASGVKTLLTGDSFCEDDIIVSYTKPSAPTPVLQSKTVSPSTSQQTVSPDSGYDGLSSVTVNAMPSGSASTPATTITANPTISVSASGLITASVSKTQGVTPSVSAGYVASGTSGTITVNGSNTNQLTAKSAQTYTPTTTDQTIASGKYLTGAQTIKGDANLLAENIKKDVVLFGITGTLESGGGGGGVTMVSVDVSDLNRGTLSSPWEYGCLVDGSSTVTRDEDLRVIVSCPENSMFVVAIEMTPPMESTGTVSYQKIYSRGGSYYYAVFAGTSGGSIY